MFPENCVYFISYFRNISLCSSLSVWLADIKCPSSVKLPHVWAVIASQYKGIPTSLSITSLGTPASQEHIKISPVCLGIEFSSNLYVDLMKCSKSTINCRPCCDDWFYCPGFNDVMTSESSSIKGVRVVVLFRVCKLNLNVNWIVDVLFMVVFMEISFLSWL